LAGGGSPRIWAKRMGTPTKVGGRGAPQEREVGVESNEDEDRGRRGGRSPFPTLLHPRAPSCENFFRGPLPGFRGTCGEFTRRNRLTRAVHGIFWLRGLPNPPILSQQIWGGDAFFTGQKKHFLLPSLAGPGVGGAGHTGPGVHDAEADRIAGFKGNAWRGRAPGGFG